MSELFNIPHLISTYGYAGIFIIVFLESGIFFALPGDSLLFTAGLLASAFGLSIFVLIPLIFVATFLGGIFGYQIGIHLHLLHRYKFWRRLIKEEHIATAHKFFDKHGMMAIIFSRFIPVVRTFTPIVAGVAKVHYNLFLKWSLISSLIWSTSVTLLGYYLGRAFPWIKDYLHWMIVLIVFVSILPGVIEYIKHKKSKA